MRFGAKTIEAGFTAWLVKFRAREDAPHSASLEHAYFLMAKAAGLDVPRTQVLGKTKRDPGYFAIERFDRAGITRLHTHTLGGLLHLPHAYPSLDYRDLLKVTRRLTRDEAAVAEMPERRFTAGVPNRAVTAQSFLEHAEEHRHLAIDVVEDLDLALAGVEAMESSGVLGQRSLPGNGRRALWAMRDHGHSPLTT